MWAFGSTLATAAAQLQQPFLYTFHLAAAPDQVVVPGVDESGDDAGHDSIEETTSANIETDTEGKQEQVHDPKAKHQTAQVTITNDDTKNSLMSTKPDNTEDSSTPMKHHIEQKELKSTKPTFVTVPAGHPPFLEALEKYSNCPPSGHWKGHFSNVARPREKPQKVQEAFYICLNGDPGSDAKYTFDEAPLPPTVHLESLVLIRGT